MVVVRSFAVLLFLFIGIISIRAQDPILITDRPDQTESAFVVAKGSLQWETGFIYERASKRVNNYSYNTSLFRYGLMEILELRLGVDFLGRQISGNNLSSSTSGFGPFTLGVKTLIVEQGEGIPQLAFLGTLVLPQTGKNEFENDHLGADLLFALEYTLQENMSLGANLGLVWSGEEGEGNAMGYFTTAIGVSLNDRLGGFAELYGYLREGKNDYRWDTGITYKVTETFQVDCSGGIGLNSIAPDYFISFGFSVLLP